MSVEVLGHQCCHYARGASSTIASLRRERSTVGYVDVGALKEKMLARASPDDGLAR
jgi:hypothetical protein